MIVKSWSLLWVAGIMFVTLGCVLIWIVAQLVRSNRAQLLATGALVPEQELAISDPGEVVLLLETPRFGSDYRNFKFEIVENATGDRTKMKYDFVRAQGAVYGVTTMRVPIGRMTVLRAGAYTLRVTGLQAGKNYSNYRIFLSRPYLGRMVLQIVGIVALPLAIGFGIASGVTPGQGVWTAIIAGFLIAVFGGSLVQIGGPTGAFVPIVAGIVVAHGYGGLAVATILAGLMLLAMGLL